MSVLPPVVAQFYADGKQYSGEVAKMQGQTEAFGRSTQTTGERIAGVWEKLSTVILGAGVGIVAVSVDLAMKYDDALMQMQRSTNLTAGQVDFLRGKILDVSTASATSADLITTGVTQLIKAGEGEKQALTDVAQAAKFAQATGGDLNATLTAAIGIQKQHIAGTGNITQTLNIMDTAIKNSQLSADDLNTALGGRALSAFSAYHVDLKSAVTVLAGFADQNLKGSRSTLVLKTGIAALEKPAVSATGKLSTQALALAKVGLNMTTIADEVRHPGGILQVMGQLSAAFDKNASSAMKAQGLAAWMQQIFGTSAGPAFTNLITRLPQLEALYGKLNTSSGAVNGSFAQFLHSPAGAVAQFKTALENAAIRIGDVILPKLTVGLMDVTRLVTAVAGSKSDQHAIEEGLGVVIGAALATKIAGALISLAGSGLLGAGSAAAVEGVGAVGIAAGAGGLVAGELSAFFGTTEILRHNLFGLGTAVNNAAGKIYGAFGGKNDFSSINYGSGLEKLLSGRGITSNATIALAPGTIDYLLGIKPRPGGGSKKPGKVTIKHTTKVYARP